jgi:hypothetical protein
MFPEHQSPNFPILRAEFEHRSLYGAVAVYEKLVAANPQPVSGPAHIGIVAHDPRTAM